MAENPRGCVESGRRVPGRPAPWRGSECGTGPGKPGQEPTTGASAARLPSPVSGRLRARLLLSLGVGCIVAVPLVGFIRHLARPGVQATWQYARPVPPSDAAAIKRQFAGIPQYPGANLDTKAVEEEIRLRRVAASQRVSKPLEEIPMPPIAVFAVPAVPETVATWHDRRMPSLKWRSVKPGP
mgnify:CR=1 FL=1